MAFDILQMLQMVGRSKRILRTGWVREHVIDPESVADHSFRLVVLCMVIAPLLKLDKEKLIKMAIIHDLGEVITGDTVVERGGKVDLEARKRKDTIERENIESLFKDMKDYEEYVDIFSEMISRKTHESKIFKQLDKMEMAMQALEYEQEQRIVLEEFFIDTKVHITEPLLRSLLEEIIAMRPIKVQTD